MYSYYKLINYPKDKVDQLVNYLNSPVGQLNHNLNGLKTIHLLSGNQFKKPPIKLIKHNLKQVLENIEDRYKPLITHVLKSNSLKAINKELIHAIDSIQNDVNLETLLFYQN